LQQLRILYQDPWLVAIDKPAGIFVHPPEDGHAISPQSNGLKILREQLGHYVYPLHRIDRATSGVVLYATSSEAASQFSVLFSNESESKILKTYFALIRGWLPISAVHHHSIIDNPLDNKASLTHYSTLYHGEFPWKNKLHSTSRYSLVQAQPITGRQHQIRRHFVHLRHPLIGDTIYGDSLHNRLWKKEIPSSGLFLKAYSVDFIHPILHQPIHIRARWGHAWLELLDRLQFCPVRQTQPN
jgi:tRNA pseudouridine65 synthase